MSKQASEQTFCTCDVHYTHTHTQYCLNFGISTSYLSLSPLPMPFEPSSIDDPGAMKLLHPVVLSEI